MNPATFHAGNALVLQSLSALSVVLRIKCIIIGASSVLRARLPHGRDAYFKIRFATQGLSTILSDNFTLTHLFLNSPALPAGLLKLSCLIDSTT